MPQPWPVPRWCCRLRAIYRISPDWPQHWLGGDSCDELIGQSAQCSQRHNAAYVRHLPQALGACPLAFWLNPNESLCGCNSLLLRNT